MRLLSVLLATAASGCGSGGSTGRVELLTFPGCPITERVRLALHEVAGDRSPVLPIHETNLETLADDDPRLGWGSPTILVDGLDLFEISPDETPALRCRLYPAGTPDAATIAAALGARLGSDG